MNRPWTILRLAGISLGFSLLPAVLLEMMNRLAGAGFSWLGFLGRWGFTLACLATSYMLRVHAIERQSWHLPWSAAALGALSAGASLYYALTLSTPAAWTVLALAVAVTLGVNEAIARGRRMAFSWLLGIAMALVSGASGVAIAQLESRFSEEEFFSAVQSLELAIFWVFLWVVRKKALQLSGVWDTGVGGDQLAVGGLRIDVRWLYALPVLLTTASIAMLLSYQGSFYPPTAPAFKGIDADHPFQCGSTKPSASIYQGEQVFERIMALVEANPHKAAPELGMLALVNRDSAWAEAFRASLLEEASQERFTGPANSVKFIQYEATLRAYYYSRVRSAFPELFSSQEQHTLRNWFGKINRRAQSVEWIDWMYGLAYAAWPSGPYWNQEIGAGLLAVLESEGLNDPQFGQENRAFLEANHGGWSTRFRNTDDAFIYQAEWINNALFQSIYHQTEDGQNRQRSFDWLLAQALPDGSSPSYNHPTPVPLGGVAYLAASLFSDEAALWIAGRSVEYLEANGGYLAAQPFLESPIGISGRSPVVGSCLLYGDSGLPTQPGPLAPDKIVLRDGWEAGEGYMLLNLRFTGWHRYKATNTVVMLNERTPLVSEVIEGKIMDWLPTGRSLFRDKRIPRENLNGFQIARSAMSRVVYRLTGIGGPWAQDPPYYAEVESFDTGPILDVSRTLMQGWRGWKHRRSIYFYHDGPVVVVDNAWGPSGQTGAVSWHLYGPAVVNLSRILIGEAPEQAEVVLLPVIDGQIDAQPRPELAESSGQDILFQSEETGRLSLATIFLTDRWLGAEVEISRAEQRVVISIQNGHEELAINLDVDLRAP